MAQAPPLTVPPFQAVSGSYRIRHLYASPGRVLLIETSGVPDFSGQRAFYTGLSYHEEAHIRDFYESRNDKVVYWKNLHSKNP